MSNKKYVFSERAATAPVQPRHHIRAEGEPKSLCGSPVDCDFSEVTPEGLDDFRAYTCTKCASMWQEHTRRQS